MLEETLDKNKDKGITLIALVVTIIVLLILAGISISYVNRSKWNINQSGRGKKKNRRCRKTGK